MSGCLTEDGWFASEDVRYRKKDSTESVSSGSSYQRYVELDSGEDKDPDTDTQEEGVSNQDLSDQLSDLVISSSSPRPRGLVDLGDLGDVSSISSSSVRGSIGRGKLVDRLKRRSEVRDRAGSSSTLN